MKLRRVLLPVALTLSVLPGWMKATTFQVRGAEAGPWTAILGSVGITEDATRKPGIIVAAGAAAAADLAALSQDHVLILEGASAAAERLGINSLSEQVAVRQITDIHAPECRLSGSSR
jgi:phage tail sheath protein FI